MTGELLIKKILDETYIIESAIEVRNFDIIQHSIQERQKYIDDLIDFVKDNDLTEVMKEDLKKYEILDKKCMVSMNQFKDEIEEKIHGKKKNKLNTFKRKSAQGSYLNVSSIIGKKFDNKK